MKVPPKRKGNALVTTSITKNPKRLNESPSQKEGKFRDFHTHAALAIHSLNESPSQKEGKYAALHFAAGFVFVASMKVPPKRKGNYKYVT